MGGGAARSERARALRKTGVGAPVLALAVLVAAAARAQDAPLPLPGPAQADALCASAFRGLDPLAGEGEITPKARQGRRDFCLAPDPDWSLVGEDRSRCCYFRPFAQRLDAVVVAPAEAATIAARGGRCGHNQFDPSTLICQLPAASATPPVPAPPPAPAPTDDRCAWDQLAPYVGNLVGALDQFWGQCLRRLQVVPTRPLRPTENRAAPGPARYANRTGLIEVNREQLEALCRRQQSLDAVALVFAHEAGHYAQQQMGLSSRLYLQGAHELHADYLAGAYFGVRLAGATPERVDQVQDQVAALYRAETPLVPDPPTDELTPWQGRDPHGTFLERLRAFRLGLRDGNGICLAVSNHTRADLLAYLTPAAVR